MKTITRTLIIASVTSLTACGGSGSIPNATDTNALPAASQTCETNLCNSLRGSYSGQIAFNSPDWVVDPEFCLWEVVLSVATVLDSVGLLQTEFEIQSDLISGTTNCADMDTTGRISGFYGVDENAPQWPIALSFSTPQVTDPFSYYAPGNVNQGTWELVADGRGNLSPDQVSEMSGRSGTLVLFSDQPKQQDDGAVSP